MKRPNVRLVVIGVVVVMALAALAAYYSDFLGARFISKGSPRLTVRQGSTNTLQLAPSNATRKLEICTEKTNIILGRSDFIDCRSLKDSVAPGATEAEVVIPKNMPLGRAIVITRIRNADGKLSPAAPTDEKITLYIVPPKGSLFAGIGGGDSDDSGGSAGDSASGGSDSSSNNSSDTSSPSGSSGTASQSSTSSGGTTSNTTLPAPSPTFYALPFVTPSAAIPTGSPRPKPNIIIDGDLTTWGAQHGVAPVDEKQELGWITYDNPAGNLAGSFQFKFFGQTTAPITIPSSLSNQTLNAAVQSALEALPAIGPGNILVETGTFSSLAVADQHTFYFTFRNGMGGKDLQRLDPDPYGAGRINFVQDAISSTQSRDITNLRASGSPGARYIPYSYYSMNTPGSPLLNNSGITHGRPGQNKKVVIRFSDGVPVGGTFTVFATWPSGSGITSTQTGPIPYNATNAQLQAILEAVPGGAGNISVTTPGDSLGNTFPGWLVEFKGTLQYLDYVSLQTYRNDLVAWENSQRLAHIARDSSTLFMLR